MRKELSPRESELARLVATGCTNQEIAARLSIRRQTVKNHVSSIFKKLSVHNRVQLTLAIARQAGQDAFVADVIFAATPAPNRSDRDSLDCGN